MTLADFRYWHETDMPSVPSNVCFGGNSGHRNPGMRGPLVTPERTSIDLDHPEVFRSASTSEGEERVMSKRCGSWITWVTLAVAVGTAAPSHAITGTVRVTVAKAGFIVSAGKGF